MEFWGVMIVVGAYAAVVSWWFTHLWYKKRPTRLNRALETLRIEVADLRDLYAQLQKSHHRLRSSASMSYRRSKQTPAGTDEIPDAQKDPDGYKRAMAKKLGLASIGGGKKV